MDPCQTAIAQRRLVPAMSLPQNRGLSTSVIFPQRAFPTMSTTAFPLNWDLSPFFPAPTAREFATNLGSFRKDLETAAKDADELPPISVSTVGKWQDFLINFERLDAQFGDLRSFIGCWAAGDADARCSGG
ncbi:MAG: hypothetical protein B7Z55_17265 [Planctomycetales bacterium 12-60-4]|nr:MAG: hypothetical protein B7Z55_17265 [Planctomycetales bacterium 12-60-4]